MNDGKDLARRTWGASPTGVSHAKVYQFGTREYFETSLTFRENIEQPWLFKLIPFNSFSGKRVLEIGFGPGFDTYYFMKAGAEYSGIDITPENVVRTKNHMAAYGFEPDVSEGDAENLGYKDDSFDIVYSNGVLHHTPDMPQAFREAYRVLKPGGAFYVIVYHRNSIYYRLSNPISALLRGRTPKKQIRYIEANDPNLLPIVNVYSRSELCSILKNTGFEVEDVSVRKLTATEFPLSSVLAPVYRLIFRPPLLEWLGQRFGWYIIARARKVL